MICKRCECIIDDDCEVCPACGKDPTIDLKSKVINPRTIIALLVCVIIAAISISLSIKYVKVKSDVSITTETTLDVTLIETESETAVVSSIDNMIANVNTMPDEFDSSTTLSDAKITEISVSNSFGKTSQYAKVTITKNQLRKTTEQEFSSFYNSKVISDNYEWVTIACDDSTGIVFFSKKDFAVYGELNSMDLISQAIGVITLNNDKKYKYTTLENISYSTDDITAENSETINEAANITEKPLLTASAEPSSQGNVIEDNNNSSVVYVTASGKKFHLDGCSYLNKSKIAITRSQAIADGYEPCSRCKP